jgi:hypothetical protein
MVISTPKIISTMLLILCLTIGPHAKSVESLAIKHWTVSTEWIPHIQGDIHLHTWQPWSLEPNSLLLNPNDQPWYADSGANNHVTAAIENLQLQEPFKGEEEVAVGNGSGLPISHAGSSLLYNSHFPFKLNNILHCPGAAANLLSIQKLCG